MQPNRLNPFGGPEEFTRTKKINQIRSQKNLNSQPFIQQNTEEQGEGHNDQGRRQTQMEHMEMRQTYGRPKIPKKLKLPWNNPKTKPLLRQNREDSLKTMIENNQYKQVQQYLPPLSIDEKEKKASNNPFSCIAKFDNSFKSFLQNNNASFNNSSNKISASVDYKYKPQEFITLEIIKSTKNTGTIKKMLHLPSFKLYASKEEPVNNKQILQSLKQWLQLWKQKLNEEEEFLKIINVEWNNAECYFLITSEYLSDGSLDDLLEAVGTLPENAVQEISLPIVKALNKFYTISEGGFGSISPSQVLFGPNLQIKLGLALGCRSNAINNSIYNIKPAIAKNNIFNMDESSHWAKLNHKNNNDLQRSLDILKFGIIMLRASVGNFEIFQQSTLIFQNLKELMTQNGQKIAQKQNLCCIIHSQKQIMDLIFSEKHPDKQEGDSEPAFQFMTFLRAKYSSSFIHFLCTCLKISNSKRSSIQDLMNHPFNKTKSNPNLIKVTLSDLHKITKPKIDLQSSKYHKKLDLIIKSIQTNIRHDRRQILPDFKSIDSMKIKQLSLDLGIPDQVLENKINEWRKSMTQY